MRSGWRYTVVSEANTDLNSWTAAYQPLSVVSRPDGTAYILGIDTEGSDSLQLVRMTAGGAKRRSTQFTPSSFAPGMQTLALSPTGRLFWLYSLNTGQGIAEVDPVTLRRISSKALSFDNAGLTPTADGLVISHYAGTVWRIPYTAFKAGDDSPFAFTSTNTRLVNPRTMVISVGGDGTVADLDYWPYACDGRNLSWRGPDGTSWLRDVGEILGQVPNGCEVQDADVLPSGDVVVTILAEGRLSLLRVTRDGQRGAVTFLADHAGVADTLVDADGSVLTVFARHTLCAPDETLKYCVETQLTRMKGDVVLENAGGLGQNVGRSSSGMVGQPGFAVGNGHVVLPVAQVTDRYGFDTPCARSCGGYGGTLQFRSVPITARMPGRASYSWW